MSIFCSFPGRAKRRVVSLALGSFFLLYSLWEEKAGCFGLKKTVVQKIQIRVFLSICVLLLISMLLVNLVLVMFWQGDALRRETEKDRIILAGIQASMPLVSSRSAKSSLSLLPLSDWLPNPSSGRIQVYFNRKNLLPVTDDVFGRILERLVRQTETAGHSINRHAGSFFSPVDRQKRWIAGAEPIMRNGNIVGAIGVVRSLDPMYHNLWQAEKTTLAYIIINLLVLGVVAFFRMGKLVARPIDRLVGLADQYGEREEVLFALDNDNSSDEFGRLARSLNSMLARIEGDRTKMEESVAKLEEVNRELVATRQDVIRAEKLASVGRLAAGLAHEIGNPIGVVQGYLGLLKQKDLTPSEREDFANRSEGELQRINKLIRQLLDFSCVQSCRKENVSLHVLLQELVEMMQCQTCMREVEIRTDYAAESDCIRADPDQIRQVFLNCLLNCADALSGCLEGKKIITLSTHCICSGKKQDLEKCILVSIADTGIGITTADLDNAFDPFFTTKEPGKGTGLGLSVAYSIIEGCEGSMWLESQQGQGTTVFIELPLV